jgi:hypothetical protein
MLGNVKIYFGKVVDITDTDKLFRIRVSIDGYTNEIETTNLPWYFPWYGINYLPILNDIVPVIVFDENFSTAFYGRKVGLSTSELSDNDYENYLEIFKRTIGNKLIQLTYSVTDGIQFINNTGKLLIKEDTLSLFIESNSIMMTKDKITIGNSNQEAAPLGDKTVSELHDIITHQKNTITKFLELFTKIAAACTNPFTAGIGSVITTEVATLQVSLIKENTSVDKGADKIQSSKTFIE